MLIYLLVHNCRRPGEIERFSTKDYLDTFLSIDNHPEWRNDMTNEKKEYLENYNRYLIRGKLNRNVTVMVSRELNPSLTLILNLTETVGVSSKNPYLFGLPGSTKPFKHLNANKLLTHFAIQASCRNPQNMTATGLRKNLAIESHRHQILGSDLEHLQTHMGHSDRVHKTYRQPQVIRELKQIPKYLNMILGIGVKKSVTSSLERLDSITPVDASVSNTTANMASDTSMCSTQCNSTSIGNFSELSSSNKSISQNSIDLDVTQNNPTTSFPIKKLFNESDSEYEPSDFSSESELEDNYCRKQKRSKLSDTYPVSIKRRSWSVDEIDAAKEYFQDKFEQRQVPTTYECFEAIQKCQQLIDRTPKQLKQWFQHQLDLDVQNKISGNYKRTTWTPTERRICQMEFKTCIENETYPPINKIKEVIRKHPELQHRTPKMIKSHIQHSINIHLKLKKNSMF